MFRAWSDPVAISSFNKLNPPGSASSSRNLALYRAISRSFALGRAWVGSGAGGQDFGKGNAVAKVSLPRSRLLPGGRAAFLPVPALLRPLRGRSAAADLPPGGSLALARLAQGAFVPRAW